MPTADTPVPRQLSEEERALWEKADNARREIANEVPASEPQWYTAYEAWRDHGYTKPVAEFIDGASPDVILSLLTALSSEREAGERDKARSRLTSDPAKMLCAAVLSAGGRLVIRDADLARVNEAEFSRLNDAENRCVVLSATSTETPHAD